MRKAGKIKMRKTKDEYYLDIARMVASRSTCLVRRYGCVIVKDDVVISTGYNGAPRGRPNCHELGECKRAEFAKAKNHGGYEKCDAVHAEQNAIIAAPGRDLIGATVYLACEEKQEGEWGIVDNPTPCNICKNMMLNARVLKVINGGDKECL